MVRERIANPSWLTTTAGSNPVLSAKGEIIYARYNYFGDC